MQGSGDLRLGKARSLLKNSENRLVGRATPLRGATIAFLLFASTCGRSHPLKLASFLTVAPVFAVLISAILGYKLASFLTGRIASAMRRARGSYILLFFALPSAAWRPSQVFQRARHALPVLACCLPLAVSAQTLMREKGRPMGSGFHSH